MSDASGEYDDPSQDASHLETARELVAKLSEIRTPSLEPYVPQPVERMCRMTRVVREALLYRIVDLGEGALRFFEDARLVPGCTLTRSAYETMSVLLLLQKKILGSIDSGDFGPLHEFVGRAAFGSRDGSTDHDAVQVLTAIDHLDRRFPGQKDEYLYLCEYAHPNLRGTMAAYSKISNPDYGAEFGENPSNLSMAVFGLSSLNVALAISVDLLAEQPDLETRLRSALEAAPRGSFPE